jgi:hypothetical protein
MDAAPLEIVVTKRLPLRGNLLWEGVAFSLLSASRGTSFFPRLTFKIVATPSLHSLRRSTTVKLVASDLC